MAGTAKLWLRWPPFWLNPSLLDMAAPSGVTARAYPSGVTARADPSKDALEPDGSGADPAHSPGKCTLLTMLAANPSLPSPAGPIGPDRRTH